MKIAPIDIAHKEFQKKMMGFDANEVIEFLRDVADQMEEVIRERNALKEALRDKEAQLIDARSRDEALKNAITTATRMTEQMRADAEREAKLVMNDAQQKAEMIVKDSRESLRRIYQDIAEMKRTRIQFEASLRSLVQSHLNMMDQSRSLMPEMPQAPGSNYARNQSGNQATNHGLSFSDDESEGFRMTSFGAGSHNE
jgi:cell division initiation protein